MKTVLVVSYFFPPTGGAGVQRTTKFVKYLRHFDWRAIVVAAHPPSGYLYDESLLADIPNDTKVVRVSGREPTRFYSFLNRIRLRRLVPWINLFLVPDQRIGWKRPAVRSALEALQHEKADLIYSTSPTPTAHLVARKLKQQTGLPWIADYRDPWSLNAMVMRFPLSLRKPLDHALEARVNRNADRIIANTKGFRERLLSSFDLPDSQVVMIPNGYDPEDFTNLPDRERVAADAHRPFRITYTGTFYESRNPEAFLRGVRRFLERQPEAQTEIRVVGSGSQWFRYHRPSPPILERLSLSEYVPHDAMIPELARADMFFVVVPPEISCLIPGKVFEYLYTGKPILAVANHDSDIADLLRSTGCGETVPGENTEQIAETLERWFVARKRNQPAVTPRTTEIARYSRREQAAQLAALMNSLG